MYIAVDIGGTKTLLATFDQDGKIAETVKFETDQDYRIFLEDLQIHLGELTTERAAKVAVAIPGKVDRSSGVGLDFGNLPWTDVTVQKDFQQIFGCPVLVENDANLAGLSEAHLIKDEFNKVLYITISTGIGTGIITSGIIDPDFADSEGGQMPLEHNGKFEAWESFASGSAIVERYGKRAADITDESVWREIVHSFAGGILDLLATIQPEVVVIGGGVGSHFDRFGALLVEELKRFETPLVPIPPIREAQHAEEAVIYGCYELLRASDESPTR